MAFAPSTDKRPVYIGSNGIPLQNGSIAYFVQGDPTTPKTVYTDEAETVPALNPQTLGIDGRTATEIFLGVGAYTVQTFAQGASTPDNQWDDYGLSAPSGSLITNVANVANIESLALIDTSAYQRANVFGYYAEGDMYSRFYEWKSGDINIGNGGTVIKSTSGGVGSWLLKLGNTDVLDVQIFGALPNGSTPRNGAISAAEAAISANVNIPQTLYFRTGQYIVNGNDSQTFNCRVKFDANVTFSNRAASTNYGIEFLNDFDILGETPLKAGNSVGNVSFSFQNLASTQQVNLAWLGLTNTSMDQGPKLQIAVGSIASNYTIYCDLRITIGSLTADLTIPHTIVFDGNGALIQNQFVHYLEFSGPGTIINKTSITASGEPLMVRGVLFAGPTIGTSAYNYLKFTNYKEIRASWFASDVGDGNTYPLDFLFQNANGQGTGTVVITQNTPFILDHYVNVFSNYGTSQLMTSNVVFQHEYGVVFKPTGGAHVWLAYSDFGNEYFIASDGFIVAGPKAYITWWLPPSATAAQQSAAWIYAIDSVTHGGNTLDLCGHSLALLNQATTTGAGNGAVIRNGSLSMSLNYPAIQVLTPIGELRFENVSGNSTASNSPFVSVQAGGSISALSFDACAFSSTSGGALSSNFVEIKTASGGIISECEITRSSISCANIVSALAGMSILNVHDNLNFVGDLLTDDCCVMVSNNKIQGGLVGKWQVACFDSTLIESNRFFQCDLWILDNAGYIDAVVTGNQFESTDTKWSRVVYNARTVNTAFTGAVCSENSFTGTVTSKVTCIVVTPYDSVGGPTSLWSNQTSTTVRNHRICIENNVNANANFIVPCTRGPVQNPVLNFLDSSTAFLNMDSNSGIFYLPRSAQNSLSSIQCTPQVDNVDSPTQYTGFVGIIGSSGSLNYCNLKFNNLQMATDPTTGVTGASVPITLFGLYVDIYGGN